MKKLFPLLILLAALGTGCDDGSGNDDSGTSSPGAEVRILYVNDDYAGGDGIGTKSKPFTDISVAIDYAESHGYSKIYVAVGDYPTDVGIEMVEGVSLYGGFDPEDEWSRYDFVTEIDRKDHSTTITYTGEAYECFTVLFGYGITKKTIIEGFTIKGGGKRFEDYEGDTDLYSYAVWTVGSSPIIRNNTILAGKPFEIGTGYFPYSSGICNCYSFPTIYENAIYGSTEHYVRETYAIYNRYACPIITNNKICGGEESQYKYGIYNKSPYFSPVISNNTIDGGIGLGFEWGIFTDYYGSPVISNNTINNGIINLTSDSEIYNNIISGDLKVYVWDFSIHDNISFTPRVKNNIITSVKTTDSNFIDSIKSDNLIGVDPGIDFTTDIDGDGVADWHEGYTMSVTDITQGADSSLADFTTDKKR